MSKTVYLIDLWGRGGELYYHALTKEGYQMTFDNEWEYEDHWEFDDISSDRMKEVGFKDDSEYLYWCDGSPEFRSGLHINADTCWFNVYETSLTKAQAEGTYVDEESDDFKKINKKEINVQELQCVWSQEELFQIDCDIKEFEEEWEDPKKPMTPLLGLLSDEKGSYGTYVIELEEELNPKRIIYTIGETEFGDFVDSWAYITKDNKVQHFDSALPPEGNHQGTYATLGFKLDEEKWGQQVPWDAVEIACKEGEFEFGCPADVYEGK